MPPVGYKNSNGTDLGDIMVPKSYLIDRYPELLDNFRFAGLWGMGKNDLGQLGTNDITWRSSPVQTIAGGANWKQVSGGGLHTAAIKTDGTLWTWGFNLLGQLGNNTRTNRSSPVQTVSGGTNWKQVACGAYHTAAIKTDGTLWLWGYNTYGQLGNNNITNQSSPVQTVSGGTNWKSVAGGMYHTAAIKTDGTLWTWGFNLQGQLGTDNQVTQSSLVQTVTRPMVPYGSGDSTPTVNWVTIISPINPVQYRLLVVVLTGNRLQVDSIIQQRSRPMVPYGPGDSTPWVNWVTIISPVNPVQCKPWLPEIIGC